MAKKRKTKPQKGKNNQIVLPFKDDEHAFDEVFVEANEQLEDEVSLEKIKSVDSDYFEATGGAMIYMGANSTSFMGWIRKVIKSSNVPKDKLQEAEMSPEHERFFSMVEASSYVNIKDIKKAIPLVTRRQFYEQMKRSLKKEILKSAENKCAEKFLSDNASKGDSWDYACLPIYYCLANQHSSGVFVPLPEEDLSIMSRQLSFFYSIGRTRVRGRDRKLRGPIGNIVKTVVKELSSCYLDEFCVRHSSVQQISDLEYIASQEGVIMYDIQTVPFSQKDILDMSTEFALDIAREYVLEENPDLDDEALAKLQEKELCIWASRKVEKIMDDCFESKETSFDKDIRILQEHPKSAILQTDLKKGIDELDKSYMQIISSNKREEPIEKKVINQIGAFMDEFYEKLCTRLCFAIVITKLCRLYKKGQSTTVQKIEESEALSEKLDALRAKLTKNDLSNTAILAEKKQDSLNEMQIKYDRLLKKLEKLEEENKTLRWVASTDDNNEEEPEGTPDIEEKNYPKGTILFGGHPRWQKFFSKNHPAIKIYDGNKASFNQDCITKTTPLVLVNVTHMNHPTYWRLRNRLKETGVKWEYIYPRYRGAANGCAVLK